MRCLCQQQLSFSKKFTSFYNYRTMTIILILKFVSYSMFLSTTDVKVLSEAFLTSIVIGVVLFVAIIVLVVFKHKRGKRITYQINKKVRSCI
jgi:hypothetical protein